MSQILSNTYFWCKFSCFCIFILFLWASWELPDRSSGPILRVQGCSSWHQGSGGAKWAEKVGRLEMVGTHDLTAFTIFYAIWYTHVDTCGFLLGFSGGSERTGEDCEEENSIHGSWDDPAGHIKHSDGLGGLGQNFLKLRYVEAIGCLQAVMGMDFKAVNDAGFSPYCTLACSPLYLSMFYYVLSFLKEFKVGVSWPNSRLQASDIEVGVVSKLGPEGCSISLAQPGTAVFAKVQEGILPAKWSRDWCSPYGTLAL